MARKTKEMLQKELDELKVGINYQHKILVDWRKKYEAAQNELDELKEEFEKLKKHLIKAGDAAFNAMDELQDLKNATFWEKLKGLFK